MLNLLTVLPMITIEECKKILGVSAKEYTEEQLKSIRDFFYKLAQINFDFLKQKFRYGKNSNSIHKSFNG